jgi:death on curing protein
LAQEIVFVSVEESINLHAFVLETSLEDATADVRDVGLLDSAIHRPRQLFFYEDADIPSLAATLLWGIVKNHAFYDGNKRTAWAVTQYFLSQNGYILPSGGGSVRLVLNVALGRRSIDQVKGWIRLRIEPLDLT